MKIKQLNEKLTVQMFKNVFDKTCNEIEKFVSNNLKVLNKINPNIVKMMVKKIDGLLNELNKLNKKLKKMINDETSILDYPELKEEAEKGIIRLIKLKRNLKKIVGEIDKIEVERYFIDDLKNELNVYVDDINKEIKFLASYFNDNMDELNKKLKKEIGVVLTKIKIEEE